MANPALVALMNGMTIHQGTDCSEIAEAIQAGAGGSGIILHITPAPGRTLSLEEYVRVLDGFVYHDVSTDGGFAYDPRRSRDAIPVEGCLDGIRSLNPGAFVAPR